MLGMLKLDEEIEGNKVTIFESTLLQHHEICASPCSFKWLKGVLETIEKQKEIIEYLKRLRCSSNCKYGGLATCSYPDALYTNCYASACNQWEEAERLHPPSEDIQLRTENKK